MHSSNLEKYTKQELISILQKSEQARENLEFLLENINGISWEFDLISDNFNYVSSNAERILGYKRDEWSNLKSWENMIYEEDKADTVTYCQQEIEKGESHFMEYRMVKKNGDIIWVIDSITLGRNSEGSVVKLYGFIIDVTPRKLLQLELEKKSKLLEFQAQYDNLTELPNRTLFIDRLNEAVQSAKKNKTKLALIFMDIDDFKKVNDTMGHHVGDELLREVSGRVLPLVNENNTFARLGGDEFTIILQDTISQEDIISLASKIIKLFEVPFFIDAKEFYSSCSLGISIYKESNNAKNLLKYADIAMYKAKSMGKNNFQICTK